ncbi:MAG: hypothetical protein IKE81_05435 [Clostridia bacterium]|nr:hypothetical protein [Clostridia bacterium]
MQSLAIDIETFSSEDLARSGVYRYAEAPDFRVLLFGYSCDGGPVSVVDLASGETLPPAVLSALLNDTVIKWAFNASFERVCLSRYLRDLGLLPAGRFLPPSSWRCSMVWCEYLGLPHSLEKAGEVLQLKRQKLEEGKDLVRFFCRPAKPSLMNGQSERNLPWSDPERWQLFIDYNRRDVETEEEIRQRVHKYPVPEKVWKEYALDQEINDRGIRADRGFVQSALAVDESVRSALSAELQQRTELSNPNSVAQIRKWLEDHGTEVRDLSKKQVKELLAEASEEIRPVLLLRQQLAKSSVKKYQAMADTVCADGRIRGMFRFYGASRSGRWSGRGVQLQNLPQNHLFDLSEARSLVTAGDEESLGLLYDSVTDVLSELIRTSFVPAEGKKFIVADFSAIEARVIAWLAGETWRSEAFARGKDIYCESASRMFGVPVEKNGVNGHLRQKGKVAELALGYGGGAGALRAMGALEMGVAENELKPMVDAWRKASPNIARLWRNVDAAVKTAVRARRKVDLFALSFSRKDGMLFIELPSGRCLSYVRPGITGNSFGGESVEYLGIGPAKKWERIESYGPKFVENIVQGISRDLLAEAMARLSSRGYRIVAHVHDEVIVEAEPGDTVGEVCALMAQCPPWAEGLILRADGYECEFYRKD